MQTGLRSGAVLSRTAHKDGEGDGPIIVDETGIQSVPDREGDWASVAVSSENPLWRGEGAAEMAREWFEEQFGVTFTEEVRPIAIHVVRRKDAAAQ